MLTEDWLYIVAGTFLWGVFFGYWLRKKLPTVEDMQEKMKGMP